MADTNYGILHEVGDLYNFTPLNQKDQKTYAESLNEEKQQKNSSSNNKGE